MSNDQPDGAGGRPESAADRKRAEIVRLAAELFDRKGYYRTSVDDIADAAGIRKPTLYHYFSGKQEILFWIYQDYSTLAVRRQEERRDRGVGPAESLFGLMYDVISALDTHAGHCRAYFEYQREIPEEYQRQIKDQRRHYQSMMEEVLEEGMKSGEFRQLDPHLTANALFGMVNWAYQWYDREGHSDAREVVETFYDLVMSGLGAHPSPVGEASGDADAPLPVGS